MSEIIEVNMNDLLESRLTDEADMERVGRHMLETWGVKLKNIRTKRSYITYYDGCTWEDYTQERWEITPQRAGQIITHYETVKQIETIVSKGETIVSLPSREGHTRELSKLEKPEHQAQVWKRIIENTNGTGITAKVIKAEVDRFKAELEKNWILVEDWENLSSDEQHRHLTQWQYSQKKMNQVNENIEWAAWSWNPITGCLHNCTYCYARDIANRFYPQQFKPAFIPDRLSAPKNTQVPAPRWEGDIGYKGVFVCSMSDLFGKWVPVEWIEAVLEVIRDNPQWEFLLLTKFPIRMAEFEYPENVWLCTSVDYQWAVERAEKAFKKIRASGFEGISWLSCEPMMERLTFSSLDMFDWLVYGGSSKSTQTPEYRPPFDDIVHLYNQARKAGIPVYQKTNLIPGMSNEQRLREYPIR